MAICVKLYGDLREKVPIQKYNGGIPKNVEFEDKNIRSVLDILDKLSINEMEISHIFVNGTYCGPGKIIKDGDRVGLFPRRMGLMFMEITQKTLINVKLQVHFNLERFGRIDKAIDLPEGSTIKSILSKLEIAERKFEIKVNGMPIYDENYIISDNDNIIISNPSIK
jgi:sulfur carrier protein ThiS